MERFLLTCAFIAAVLGAACTGENRIEKSPLATWDPSDSEIFFLASSGEGTLEITPGCVRLIQEHEAILLVWPEPTSWNASSQLIEFVGVFGERLELRDGYKIRAGGVGIPLSEFTEEDTSTKEYLGEPSYVLPPDPTCKAKAEELFVLHSISPPLHKSGGGLTVPAPKPLQSCPSIP